MCRSLYIDNDRYDGIRELRAAVGKESVIICGGYAPFENNNTCLCPVDMKATAAKLGVKLMEDHNHWYMATRSGEFFWQCMDCLQFFRIDVEHMHGSSSKFIGPFFLHSGGDTWDVPERIAKEMMRPIPDVSGRKVVVRS